MSKAEATYVTRLMRDSKTELIGVTQLTADESADDDDDDSVKDAGKDRGGLEEVDTNLLSQLNIYPGRISVKWTRLRQHLSTIEPTSRALQLGSISNCTTAIN